ncbi:MAG: HEAT repeat domain-containing protein [Oligoflexia bacterium]|nr:HEAT repeat domain-containing protein [Oligoflexia bacterium]
MRSLSAILCVFVILAYAIARWFSKGPLPDLLLLAVGLPLMVLFAIRIVSLRTQFVAAIMLITTLTAGIIFWSLSILETREQVARIEHQSVIFSRFSSERLVSNFVKNFEHNYLDRFLPSIRELTATDENLVSVQIISARSRNVLFDSEKALGGKSAAVSTPVIDKAHFSKEAEEELLSRDLVSRKLTRDGEPSFSVISTYRAENGEAVFLVNYLFSYRSLQRSLRLIRHQILLDLVPATILGFLIALGFAQILIAPIRALMAALGKVTSGDYSAQVRIRNQDEIGELASAFNLMTEELRRKKELRKFLSNSSYQRIIRATEQGEGRIGGRRMQATILFSDIRNFVAHCEALDAEDVTSMLNDYFTEMVEVIHRNGGEVDKFIGDAILAVFYEEAGNGESSLQAIYCALGMKARLLEFNARRASQGKPTLEIGVGISRGEIISGPIGSDDRMDFTVIGDVVNLANRIEKLSKQGKHTRVVFSDAVEAVVRGLLDYEEIEVVGGIRGKSEEVRVFELVRIKDIDTLKAHLEAPADQNPELRVRSVELLGQSGHRDAVKLLAEALSDKSEAVRIAAAGAIARAAQAQSGSQEGDQTADAVRALFARLRNETALKPISALITSIGKLCRTNEILALEPFLKFKDERIVANAVEALGWSKAPRAADLILPLLSSKNNRIKANAAMALFSAGHVEVIDALKPMLMHSDAPMRSSAAFAIGELTLIADLDSVVSGLKDDAAKMRFYLAELQDCVPMLVSLLRDPDPIVRRQSVIALGKIKDKAAVLPMIEMLDGGSKDSLAVDILNALRSIGSHRVIRDTLARLS